LEATRVLAQAEPGELSGDEQLQSILETLRSVGVAFRGSDGARLFYSLRGEEKGSLTVKHLADMLAQMREQLRRVETAAQGHADGARAEDV
jgi:hypothetical protein